MTQATQAEDYEDVDTDEETSGPLPAPRVWARVVSTNPRFSNLDFADACITFGRKRECTVSFKELSISGKHCRIWKEDQEGSKDFLVWVEDLSTNGTFINGSRIGKGNKQIVSNGTEIVLQPKGKDKDKISYILYIMNLKRAATGGVHEHYDIREKLGSGAFAEVRLCVDRRTGDKFAMKIVDKKKFEMIGTKRKNAIMDEVNILKQIDHPNVIGITNMIDTTDTMYIVLELVTGGELFDHLVDHGAYSDERARDIFGQMLQAVKYLHGKGIAHRDLKPENILLVRKNEDRIKISDFGLSRLVGNGSFLKTICGTPQYLAPEVLIQGNTDTGYGFEVDLWSMGVILYILLSGSPPFHDGRPIPILQQVKNADFDFPKGLFKNVPKSAINLVKRLLEKDPKDRITTAQIEKHPWMQGQRDLAPKSNSKKRGRNSVSSCDHDSSNSQGSSQSSQKRARGDHENDVSEAAQQGPPTGVSMAVGEMQIEQ